MGILHMLFGYKKKAVAPYQTTSNLPFQENYAGYTQLPNLPQGSLGDYRPDPNRLHAPFPTQRGKDRLITNAGVHFFPGSDPAVENNPRSPLQEYFDEKKMLPPVIPAVPAHGVFAPRAYMQRGSYQQFVPEAGRRAAISAVAPVQHLSTPINVFTRQAATSFDTVRGPITGAKAPKAKKGVR